MASALPNLPQSSHPGGMTAVGVTRRRASALARDRFSPVRRRPGPPEARLSASPKRLALIARTIAFTFPPVPSVLALRRRSGRPAPSLIGAGRGASRSPCPSADATSCDWREGSINLRTLSGTGFPPNGVAPSKDLRRARRGPHPGACDQDADRRSLRFAVLISAAARAAPPSPLRGSQHRWGAGDLRCHRSAGVPADWRGCEVPYRSR